MAEFPEPKQGIALTHFIVSNDVERSHRFYTAVLGGETMMEGRADDRRTRERLDHHQHRREPNRRQADSHAPNAPDPDR